MAENGMIITKLYFPEQRKEAESKGKLRAAAYCRVSTESDAQLTSYETQVSVYREKIREHEDWVFAGIYADQRSGTEAARRTNFLRMIKDCEDEKIDVILCKSLSRFSRNTLDAVNYIRRIKELGVRLILEKEGIDTSTEISEMMLTILAAFAQEESRSISDNVKWGRRKRAQKGVPSLIPAYGYRKNDAGDNYEVVPEEAEAVKLIFDFYEHGTSVPQITRILEEKGYPMPDGQKKVWDESRIHYMITNEKYVGDLQTQKFYKKSFMEYRGYRNDGVLPSKYLKDHHEPIISREQFKRCNVILELKKKSKPGRQYPFDDFLRCPYCGHVLFFRRLDIQYVDSHFCCEGEGACREFAIMAAPLRKQILLAYNELELEAVRRIAGQKRRKLAEEAKKLLEAKEKYPAFETIEYWWLDEFVREFSFGQHSYTASALQEMDETVARAVDDRTVTITWKCGLTTTVPSGVVRDSHDPRHKAELWDNFILRYPERYPALAEQVRKKRGIE